MVTGIATKYMNYVSEEEIARISQLLIKNWSNYFAVCISMFVINRLSYVQIKVLLYLRYLWN